MRREQVLKLCANHLIVFGMSLKSMNSSENSWCWRAHDFSEEGGRDEQLCVRFKTRDEASRFKETFDACMNEVVITRAGKCNDNDGSNVTSDENSTSLQSLGKSDDIESGSVIAAYSNPAVSITATAGSVPTLQGSSSLSSLFKPKDGEWDCEACYVKNAPESVKCVACESTKPGGKKTADSTPAVPIIAASTAGSVPAALGSSSLSSLFKPKDGEWSCDACYVKNTSDKEKCAACETPKPGFKSTAEAATVTQAPVTSFKFGAQGGFSFAGSKVEGGSNSSSAFSQGFKSASAKSLLPIPDAGKIGIPVESSGDFKFPSSGSFTFGAGKPADGNSVKQDAAPVFLSSKPTSPVSGLDAETSKPSVVAPVFKLGVQNMEKTNISGDDVPGNWPQSAASFKFGSTPLKSNLFTKDTVATKGTATATLPSSFAFSTPSPIVGKDVKIGHVQGTPSKAGFGFAANKPAESQTSVSGFNFTLAASTNSSTSKTPNSTVGKFGQTPQSLVSPAEGGGLYRNTDGEDDHIYFEPIVRLPDNVEIVTGEEDEDVLFENRGKLFRFVDKEWKERGLGDIKVLRRRDTLNVRVLMRREKLLKVCLNHAVTGDLELKPMPAAQVCCAADFKVYCNSF